MPRKEFCPDVSKREDLQTIAVFITFNATAGRIMVMQHAVYVRDDAPVHQKPYWIPYSQREAVKEELDKMLVENTIWPLTSPWASPMVLVPKKDG